VFAGAGPAEQRKLNFVEGGNSAGAEALCSSCLQNGVGYAGGAETRMWPTNRENVATKAAEQQ